MDLKSQIAKLKEEKLARIREAASERLTEVVIAESKDVEEIERLEKELKGIEIALDNIEKKRSSRPIDIPDLEKEDIPPKKRGKKRGHEKRAGFVEKIKARGIDCRLRKGVTYDINNRAITGIAYSSETRPNRWWLGLPARDFDAIVLLCEKSSGEIKNFILPKQFIQRCLPNLSRDEENNQVKFNVFFKNGRYQIKIPHGDHVDINDYIDCFENLRRL